MRFKKFLIIPALILIYVFDSIGIQTIITEYSTSGPLTVVSIGEANI